MVVWSFGGGYRNNIYNKVISSFLTDINLIGESKVSMYVGKFYNDIISGDISLKIHTCTVSV